MCSRPRLLETLSSAARYAPVIVQDSHPVFDRLQFKMITRVFMMVPQSSSLKVKGKE